MALMQDSSKVSFVKIGKIVEKLMREKFPLYCEKEPLAAESRKPVYSLSACVAALDDRLLSFEPGKLYVIGGRPGIGKTTLMTQIAVNIAASKGKPVYLLSLEEFAEQLVMRIFSQIVDVSQNSVRNGALTYEEKELIAICRSVMSEMPVYICDEPSCIYNNGRFTADEIDDGILMIDYLQLFQLLKEKDESGNDPNFGKAPAQRQCEVISALKSLAREKRIPVVVCSHLARAAEQRGNKRPTLQDLPTAREIDGAVFLYSDPCYTKDENANEKIIISINCGGQAETVYAEFDNRRVMFKGRPINGTA